MSALPTTHELQELAKFRKPEWAPRPRKPARGQVSAMKDGIRTRIAADGRPSYQVRVAGTDKTFRNLGEARAARDAARDARNKGARPVVPNKVTVSEWLDTYISQLRVAETTREGRTQNAVHIKRALGDRKLRSITSADVARLFAPGGMPGLSASTQRLVATVFKAALAAAVVQNLIAGSPAAHVKRPTVARKPLQSTLSDADIDAMLALPKIARSELWLPLCVLARTGLRRGELLALRWDWVDLDAGSLTVGGTVQRTKRGLHVAAPKTANSVRTIPIDDALVAALRRHRDVQAAQWIAAGAQPSPSWLIFPTAAHPEALRNPDTFAGAMVAKLKGTAFAWVRPHELRRAAGTRWLRKIGPAATARLMGHTQEQLLKDYSREREGDAEVARSGKPLPGADIAMPERDIMPLRNNTERE